MKTYAKIILSLLLVVLIAVSTTACNEQLTIDNGQLTIKEKTFVLEVIDIDKNVTTHTVTTTEATVGSALLAEGIIEGDVGEWGLMVMYVNGLRADFIEDGAYWAFYIDGEFAMTGVDSANIEEGVLYAFIYTPA